jgi:hypothetical protein
MDVVRQLAHELQHASEVAVASDVVDDASVKRLYEHIGYSRETRAVLAESRRRWRELVALQRELDAILSLARGGSTLPIQGSSS